MAYCVHCGIKIADGEKKCPICNIEINDPLEMEKKDVERLYPDYIPINEDKVSKKSFLTLFSMIFLLPMILVMVCDYSINHRLGWSIYVVGSLMIIYLPLFMYVLFIPNRHGMRQYLISIFTFVFTVDALLLYIQHRTGGNWVSSFAGPIVLAVGLLIIALIYFRIKRRWTKLGIAALFLVFTGLLCVMIEFIAIRTFASRMNFRWSYYPFITCMLIALIFFYIDKNKVLKEQLKRKLFI
ncbi:MAG: hypothetical protein IKI62_06135 [Clostridia bacterium]|nr:hypothetical protein [Clostridia bacterium]